MKREIKIKLWDTQTRKMIPPKDVIGLEGELSKKIHPRFIPLQYIGRADAIGRSIFEGDIMQHANELDKPLVVSFNNEICAFVFNDGFEGYEVFDKSFTIIGNIYENPELL